MYFWPINWRLPKAKQDLAGKENLNTPTVLNDLLYSQVVLLKKADAINCIHLCVSIRSINFLR